MVVFGGIYALDSDDESAAPLISASRKPSSRAPSLFLTPRPWTALYNNRLPVPHDPKARARLGLIQRLLPDDVMAEIFKRCAPADVSRAACACRPWRLLASGEKVWERHCRLAWAHRENWDVTRAVQRDRFHGSWRRMFFERVRVRTEGVYVSRNTYIKPGVSDWDNVKPVHLVCYYRYFRFFATGEFMTKTSPRRLREVYKTFKSKYLASRDDTMQFGGYEPARVVPRGTADANARETPRTADRRTAVSTSESRFHLACVPAHRSDRSFTETHAWLRLRSTHPGASNRLDFVNLAMVDGTLGDPTPPVPHPTEEEWAEVDDEGLAYRRSCGVGAKRYDGTMPVRELTRGLNTLVFVPWEDCEEHVLNNTTEQMDFFVTG